MLACPRLAALLCEIDYHCASPRRFVLQPHNVRVLPIMAGPEASAPNEAVNVQVSTCYDVGMVLRCAREGVAAVLSNAAAVACMRLWP
jgi:hypothetical protein